VSLAVAFLVLLPLSRQVRPVLTAQAASSHPVLGLHKLGRLVSLSGSLLPHLSQAHRTGALASSRTLSAAISLKVRDRAGLDKFLRDLYTPGSPLYRHYLTPDQFAQHFAPAAAERQRVADWLSSQGLQVVQRSRNGLILTAVGSVGRMEAAFGTHLDAYRQGAQSFFANARPIQVPRALAPEIVAVSGLNSAERQHRLGWHVRSLPRGPARDSNGPNGMWPSTLQDFYDISAIHQAGYTGSNQTIAVVLYTDISPSDLSAFTDQWNMPGWNLQRIPVSDGAKKGGSSIVASEQGEAEMDLEVAHSVAPGAQLLAYQGPGTDTGLYVFNQIVSDDRAPVISTSYGLAESQESAGEMNAFNQIFEEAAAQGQSILAASGDNGAYDAAAQQDDPKKDTLQVDFPASDPWVTGVGGTSLYQRSDNSIYEKPWADTSQDPHTGGGGGLSTYWKRPDYQTGPGVQNQYSNGMRQVPDVSAFAGSGPRPGFDEGYAIYTTIDGRTGWHQIDGTSASTPFWAGYAALMNQSLQQFVGFLNPTLYVLGQKASTFQHSPYNDVVEGDNLYYPATPGWDFASGWGSMDGAALIEDIGTMGGPQLVHPADWTMKAVVARLQNKKYLPLSRIKRGQKIYLLLRYDMIAVPGTPDMVREFTLASPSRTLYHGTNTIRIDKSSIGKVQYRSQGFTVPNKAPKGTYTLTVKVTVAGYTQEDSAQVQLR